MTKDCVKVRLCQWLAYRCPPRLRYFICIDAWAKTTTGIYGTTIVSSLTVDEMIRRLEQLP